MLPVAVLGERIACKSHRYARAAGLDRGERHFTAVFLDDLVDDRQTQTGAFFARGHIRFENVDPVLRQPNSVILHRDDYRILARLDRDQDLAAVIDVGRLEFGFNRFVSILERIGACRIACVSGHHVALPTGNRHRGARLPGGTATA